MNAAALLSSAYLASYPQEAAKALQAFPPPEVSQFLSAQSASNIASVLSCSLPYLSAGYLDGMDAGLAAKVIGTLDPERAIPPLRHLGESARERIFDHLPKSTGIGYREILRWPEGTAGAAMNPFLTVLTDDTTIAEAMKRTRSQRKAAFFYPFVVDSKQKLVGAISIRGLMQARPNQTLRDIVEEGGPRVFGSTPLSQAVRTLDWKPHESIPVVDDDGILLGAIRRETLENVATQVSLSPSRLPLADGILSLGELYGQTAIELMPMLAQGALGNPRKKPTDDRNDQN